MNAEVLAEDGCRLWTDRAGNGSPLVLCHGGPGQWDYFDDVADMLRDHAQTVRWDQRGCGRSQRRGPYSVARSIADLDAVRDQLAGPRMACWATRGVRTSRCGTPSNTPTELAT